MSEFNNKIKHIESEIIELKTSHTKSSGVLKTKTLNANVTLNLVRRRQEEGPFFSYYVCSDQKAIVTLTDPNGNDFISMMTLGISDAEQRIITTQRQTAQKGQCVFALDVISWNTQDEETIIGGGSVILNYPIKLIATSDFSLSINYIRNEY